MKRRRRSHINGNAASFYSSGVPGWPPRDVYKRQGTPSDEDGDDADKPVCTCAAACSEDAPNGDCPVCREDPADCMGTPSDEDGDDADKPVCTCAAACSEDAPNGDCPVCRENPADCGRAPVVLPDAGSANGLLAAEGAGAPEEPEIVVYFHSNWPDAEDETVVREPVQSDSLYVWLDNPWDVFGSSLDLNTWGFAGWNTQRDGSGRSYASHDKAYIKIYGDGLPIEYHFYAQWDTNSGPMDYRVTLARPKQYTPAALLLFRLWQLVVFARLKAYACLLYTSTDTAASLPLSDMAIATIFSFAHFQLNITL